jgi:allantoin racemase
VTSFRLALVNPNTDARHTEAMANAVRDVLPSGCEVVPWTARRGPVSIESSADEAVASGVVVELVRDRPDLDGYLIACFGDPAVDAARELTEAPVVGIAEAAYLAATLVARRFAVITTLARGIPELEDGLRVHGLDHRCVGILPLEIPVTEQGSGFGKTTEAILAASRHAVGDLGAEAVVLACGAMTDVARTVQEEVRVPVCDGVAIGALLVWSLARAGLRTSKVGSLAWPELINYVGVQPLSPRH